MAQAGMKSRRELLREVDDLQAQLAEAQETLRAIREGEVDAIVVSGSRGELVFSLAGAESVYRLIVETMKEAALTVALDGTILFCNAQFGEFVHNRPEQIVGHRVQTFIAVEHQESIESLLITSRSQPVKQRLLFQNRDGVAVPAHVSSHAINQPDGSIICIVVTDLTQIESFRAMLDQLRSQQEALRRANEQLTEVDRRKDEFLAMLAHELRNPLAALSSAIELLRVSGLEDPRIEAARMVAERQTGHMARLLNDLLDVSRVTQGKIRLQKVQISISEAIEDAIAATGPLMAAKGHRFSLKLPAGALTLEADPLRLTQVFSNILNNAAKYTPPGGEIEMTVVREQDEALIRLRDSGAGITPELLPRVFDLFVQAERSPDREQGGLGIGLTMARSLVAMHGGCIEARSDGPGRGSEFTVRLPLLGTPGTRPQDPDPGTAEPVARRRIMVVDDNVDMVEMMAALLELEGHEVATALSGEDALEIAVRNSPEVALIDIGMPGMDGFELARRLKAHPALKRTLLVAISGYGREVDLQKSRQAGFAHHLLKPVDPEDLRRVLRVPSSGAGTA
jgi:PAS domain S-box-containing protein